MKTQIRISGSGGQGIILAGILLAEAGIIDGKKALQSQSYGPESRGGSSRADVIISDEIIYFPRAVKLDTLLCLTQEAADKFIDALKSAGTFIYDSSQIRINPIEGEAIGIPFSELSIKKFKTTMVTNILSLAFTCRITNTVSLYALRKALRKRIKPKYVDINLKAVRLGVRLAEEYLSEGSLLTRE